MEDRNMIKRGLGQTHLILLSYEAKLQNCPERTAFVNIG